MSESRADRARRVLAPTQQALRDSTRERLEAAIVRLKARNIPITRESLQAETADPTTDPSTPGIHPATMGRRQDLLDLIEDAQDVTYPSADLTDVKLNHLRGGRVLGRVLTRLKAKDHDKLAEYSLVLEEEVVALRQELAEVQLRNMSLHKNNQELEKRNQEFDKKVFTKRTVGKKGTRKKAIKKMTSAGEDQSSDGN